MIQDTYYQSNNFYRFLVFRRCAVLTTMIVNYLINKAKPEWSTAQATALITIGAFIAGVSKAIYSLYSVKI